MCDIVPESFSIFLPDKTQINYKFSPDGLASGSPAALVASNLMTAIRSKCSADDVMPILKELGSPMEDDERESAYNPAKIEVFVQVNAFFKFK